MNDPTLVVDRSTAADMAVAGSADQGGLPWRTFEKWMGDIRNQPAWRALADKCADYYDGNQLTPEQLSDMEAAGMAPIVANIVRPTVDVVLGMEAKTRQDWRVVADANDFQDVAEARSMLLAEAEREAKADRACSDAYAGQIKAGLHWVEVSRSMNPFEYPYRVTAVHRREIWWDWRDMEPDLPRARFLLRRRWVDLDNLIAVFPQHTDVLEQVGTGRITFNRFDLTTESQAPALVDAHTRELRTTLDDLEWRDTERGMLCLGEMWYRTWHRGFVIKIGGRVIPVDTGNPAIAAAIALGRVRPQAAVYPKIRLSWWVGPHRLEDVETKRTRYPYVPFWGFREDRTGRPYGLIRPMIDPQDEYNARRAKLMWLLSAKRVYADSDVLDTNYNSFADLAREVNRPDMMAILNPDRKPNSSLKVETDHGLATQQFQVMQDAQNLLQQTAGVYQSMMGQTGSATSGLAINSLVEQGATTLAEINDNYRFARRLVGELLMELIVEDIGGEPYEVNVGEGSRQKKIVLNARQPDGSIINDNLRASTKVALADVPSTPSYRAQQLNMLAELTKSLPPNIQASIIDFVIEATDLPQRRKMADRVRKALNIQDPDDMTPEEQQQAQAMLAEQQNVQRQAAAVQLRSSNADAAEKEARAQKASAEARKIAVETAAAAQELQAGGKATEREQALQAQLDAILAEAEQARSALETQCQQVRLDAEQQLAELRDALASAQLAAESRHAEADSAVRVAEIERDARVAEANAEVRKAEIEARARVSEEAIEQRFEAQMKGLRDQIAGIRAEAGKSRSESAPAPTVVFEQGAFQIDARPAASKTITIESGGKTLTGTIRSDNSGETTS